MAATAEHAKPAAAPLPAAQWSRALVLAPSRKFAAAGDAYEHAGLCDRRTRDGLVRANVEFTYRYYCRIAALGSATARATLHATVEPEGIDRLTGAASRGRGVILVSAHMGDFDVIGSWIAQVAGLQVVVVSDPLAQRSRQAFFDGVRRAGGLTLRRRDRTRREDLEGDLRAGRVVLWMLDRAARGPVIPARFLGRPAQLPIAPHLLARRTGCSLVAGATSTGPDGRRTLQIGEELRVHESGGDPHRTLAALAAVVTRGIQSAPWQWHVPVRLDQLCLLPWGERAQSGAAPMPSRSGDEGDRARDVVRRGVAADGRERRVARRGGAHVPPGDEPARQDVAR